MPRVANPNATPAEKVSAALARGVSALRAAESASEGAGKAAIKSVRLTVQRLALDAEEAAEGTKPAK